MRKIFKILITFKTVYELKSFSKASEKLFISQSAISIQIRALEEYLGGVKLFNRNGRQKITSTVSGDLFYKRMLDFIDLWSDIKNEVISLSKNQKNRFVCKIGSSQTFSRTKLIEVLPDLQMKFPNVDFELTFGDSNLILNQVESHYIHFGFVEKKMNFRHLNSKPVTTDELVLAGNLSNSLWLIREKNSGSYMYTMLYFNDLDIIATEKIILGSNELIVSYLKRGIGKAIISKKYISEGIPYVSLGKKYTRTYYIVNKKAFSNNIYIQIYQYMVNLLK